MRKTLFTVLLVFIIATAVMASGCGGDTTTATSTTTTTTNPTTTVEPIVLKYATFSSESHGWSQVIIRWEEKITEETGGRVEFQNYFSGTLIGAPNAVSELAAGVADFGAGYIALQKSGFELSNAIRAWYYGDLDTRTVSRIDKELWDKYPEIRAEYDSLKVLGGWNNPGPYWISTENKPVRSKDDMKGLNLKSSSWVAQLEALGAAPVAVSMPDAYISLQKGIIEGVMAPLETMYGYSLWEVTKYHTNLGMFQSGQPELLFNWDSWNNLPADIQQIFEDSMPWCEEELIKAVIAMEDEGIAACEQREGNEFIEMSAENLAELYAVMDTVSAQEAAALDAKGYPGTEIFNEVRRLITLYSNE